MRRSRLIVAVAIPTFIAGFAAAQWAPRDDARGTVAPAEDAAAAPALPVAAQEAWFPPVEEYTGEALTDEKFDALLATLRDRLEAEETLADFEREAATYFHSFIRRVEMPELTPDQTSRTYAYMAQLAERHPDHERMIRYQREMIEEYYGKANGSISLFGHIAGGWFAGPRNFHAAGEPFADETVDEMIGILDLLLTMPETVADFEYEAGVHFGRFADRLQTGRGRLTEEQTARIVAYFDEIEARHPDSAELIGRNRFQVQNLVPGRTAPNISGKDAEGIEFSLNDYLGNIVVIYFSGQWCGPCQLEYPYQRFMLELYEGSPVAILGVNSDSEIETVREIKENEGLDYRVWWDGHGEVAQQGPIATEWNVTSWPAIYILDENGVIRYAQKRGADVVGAVSELLAEKYMREQEQGAGT